MASPRSPRTLPPNGINVCPFLHTLLQHVPVGSFRADRHLHCGCRAGRPQQQWVPFTHRIHPNIATSHCDVWDIGAAQIGVDPSPWVQTTVVVFLLVVVIMSHNALQCNTTTMQHNAIDMTRYKIHTLNDLHSEHYSALQILQLKHNVPNRHDTIQNPHAEWFSLWIVTVYTNSILMHGSNGKANNIHDHYHHHHHVWVRNYILPGWFNMLLHKCCL